MMGSDETQMSLFSHSYSFVAVRLPSGPALPVTEPRQKKKPHYYCFFSEALVRAAASTNLDIPPCPGRISDFISQV